MSYKTLTRDEHFQNEGPKRILSLDGGGLRGILTLGFLKRIESVLQARHGGDTNFRLCHYFDLIAGTSTGAIIAAALGTGMSVDEVIGHYRALGTRVFKKSWFRHGIITARYDEAALIESLQEVFGAAATLGGNSLKTGVLIVTKRMDTGSPWPLGNNPRGKYFKAKPTDNWISNSDFPLWQVVRASTAAPSYFNPESIVIASQQGKKPVVGNFVDGGVSPFNNPSLQALMYATIAGYEVKWKTGPDQLLLVSVGTGASDPSKLPSRFAAEGALKALTSLMDDCASLVETMMQWMSSNPSAGVRDREIGNLSDDHLAGTPLLSYQRYDVDLTRTGVDVLCPGLSDDQVACLGEMDNVENLELLLKIGELAAKERVQDKDFAPAFNLRK